MGVAQISVPYPEGLSFCFMFGVSSKLSVAILEGEENGLNSIKHMSQCDGKRDILVQGGIAKRDAVPTSTVGHDSIIQMLKATGTASKTPEAEAYLEARNKTKATKQAKTSRRRAATFYKDSIRHSIKEQFPDAKGSEITTKLMITSLWNGLTPAQQAPFMLQAENDETPHSLEEESHEFDVHMDLFVSLLHCLLNHL